MILLIVGKNNYRDFRMNTKKIKITELVNKAKRVLETDKTISPQVSEMMNSLITAVELLSNRLNKNSRNSSKPPSKDENRERGSNKKKSKKNPGGQKGHVGYRLQKADNPDHIEELLIDRRTLPKGNYKNVGFESRQVFDIEILTNVTEYRAEILEDQNGNRFVAEFPSFVTQDVQYGIGVKVNAVYSSQFQLIPYDRLENQFEDQMNLPISVGTLFNFNKKAYRLLENFEPIVKQKLIESGFINFDETGVNIKKKKHWIHVASNGKWTFYYPHQKRGKEAIEEMEVLPNYTGTVCHDHWKPYYIYDLCLHALCNAHHKRELTRAYEEDGQKWALKMEKLLSKINKDVEEAGGKLNDKEAARYRKKYRRIIENAEQDECPEPIRKKGQKGRLKKTQARNLLERLKNYADDVLRFMEDERVSYTNNQAENDLRMLKVQQKISGCFRSFIGAKIHCRIRSYISTCQKHGIRATEALEMLFRGELPDFLNSS
jgi:transposase